MIIPFEQIKAEAQAKRDGEAMIAEAQAELAVGLQRQREELLARFPRLTASENDLGFVYPNNTNSPHRGTQTPPRGRKEDEDELR